MEVRRRSEVARGAPVYLIDREGFERAGLLYPFAPTCPAGDLRILAQD